MQIGCKAALAFELERALKCEFQIGGMDSIPSGSGFSPHFAGGGPAERGYIFPAEAAQPVIDAAAESMTVLRSPAPRRGRTSINPGPVYSSRKGRGQRIGFFESSLCHFIR